MTLKRRTFLKKSTFSAISLALGADFVFASSMPKGYLPIVFQGDEDFYTLYGKHKDLDILIDRPWNVETPVHLLDDAVTPADKLFVRNNGKIPQEIDPNTWTLTIEGESVLSPKTYSLQELKTKFPKHTFQLTLECGGNGRKEFSPPAKGAQWSYGAVGCPSWTGIRLKDILNDVGIKDDAVYIGYYGKDVHLSGSPDQNVISRGVPIKKALEEHSLLAWSMNSQDLPLIHGYPLRLVFGGWAGSTSGKWVNRIVVRNKIHDGEKMGGSSYRVPCKPVAPGAVVADEDMCIIEAMPVKSIITFPRSGAVIKKGQKLDLRGHSWAGDLEVNAMDISIDFGATWKSCNLKKAKNFNAWQQWSTVINFPQEGYYEVWARAIDSKGKMQPMVIPNWNPQGYINNACHRIAIKVV
ncbi:MAG: sulfite oxidase [Bacteroidota bacterium]|nr:sulfite oxidase [Bacteroidota bacterium]